jgi:hypothetical protein
VRWALERYPRSRESLAGQPAGGNQHWGVDVLGRPLAVSGVRRVAPVQALGSLQYLWSFFFALYLSPLSIIATIASSCMHSLLLHLLLSCCVIVPPPPIVPFVCYRWTPRARPSRHISLATALLLAKLGSVPVSQPGAPSRPFPLDSDSLPPVPECGHRRRRLRRRLTSPPLSTPIPLQPSPLPPTPSTSPSAPPPSAVPEDAVCGAGFSSPGQDYDSAPSLPPSPPPLPREVRAPGHCWERLYPVLFGLSSRLEASDHVTAEQLLASISETVFSPTFFETYFVEWSLEDDGDFHISDFKRRGPRCAKWVDGSYVPLPGWTSFATFVETLKSDSFKSPSANDSGCCLDELVPRLVGSGPDFFLDSPHRNPALAVHVQDYIKSVRSQTFTTPYRIPPSLSDLMATAGLAPAPEFAAPHPHPFHAALEKQMLWWAHGLLSEDNWLAMFLNPVKVGGTRLPRPAAFFNPRLDGKDFTRYAQSEVPTDLSPVHPSPCWLAHDVLHHLSPSTVGSWFDRNVTLQHLVATAVIPPELLRGWRAIRPSFYDFSVEGDTLTYVPEGDTTGSYTQPAACVNWLRTSRLVTPAGECLHVSIVHSRFAHHVFLISRGELIPQPSRTFDSHKMAVVPRVAAPTWPERDRLVPLNLFESILKYARRSAASDGPAFQAKLAVDAYSGPKDMPLRYSEAAIMLGRFFAVVDWRDSIPRWAFWPLYWAQYFVLFLVFVPSHIYASMVQQSWTDPFATPTLLSCRTRWWVASSTDLSLSSRLCNRVVEVFYLPPDSSLLARVSVLLASAFSLIWLKLVCAWPFEHLPPYAPYVGHFISWFWWVLEWNAERCILFLLGSFLAWQFRLTIPYAVEAFWTAYYSIVPPMRPLSWYIARAYAHVFFLPCLGLPVRAGLSWAWLLLLCLEFPAILLPRIFPWDIVPHRLPRAIDWYCQHDPSLSACARSRLGLFATYFFPSDLASASLSFPFSFHWFFVPIFALIYLVLDILLSHVGWSARWIVRPGVYTTRGAGLYRLPAWCSYLVFFLCTAFTFSLPALFGWAIFGLALLLVAALFFIFAGAFHLVILVVLLIPFCLEVSFSVLAVCLMLLASRLIFFFYDIPLWFVNSVHGRPVDPLLDPPIVRAFPNYGTISNISPPPRTIYPLPWYFPRNLVSWMWTLLTATSLPFQLRVPEFPTQFRHAWPLYIPYVYFAWIPYCFFVVFPVWQPPSNPLPFHSRAHPSLPLHLPLPATAVPGQVPARPPVPAPGIPAGGNVQQVILPPGPVDALPPRGAAPPDDALWHVHPANMTFAQFTAFFARLPNRPPAALAALHPANMCVWDTLATILGVDVFDLWLCWMAHVDATFPDDRVLFENGSVPYADIPRIAAFFQVGLRVTYVNHMNLAPANSQPCIDVPAQQDYPIGVCRLRAAGNFMHLEPLPPVPALQNFVLHVPADGFPAVAMSDVRLAPIDYSSAVNIPAGVYHRTYDLLRGAIHNAASVASAAAGFHAVPHPRLNAPPPPMAATPLVAESRLYELTPADRGYAAALAADLKAFPSVMEISDVDAKSLARGLDSVARYGITHPIELITVNGVAGAGKSWVLRELLRIIQQRPDYLVQDFKLHTWNATLREQLRREFSPLMPGCTPSNFPSFTRPLYEGCSGTVVFDDAGLLWPGFIPLFLLANPGVDRVICTFDSAQAQTAFPKPNTATRDPVSCPSTLNWLSGLSTEYCTVSRRLSVENAALFGLRSAAPHPGYAVTHGNVIFVSNYLPNVPILCASPRYAEVLAGSGLEVTTFASCQGLSTNGDVQIDLGGLSGGLPDAIMWTALTRARGNIFLVMNPTMSSPSLQQEHSFGTSRIVSSLLAVAAVQQTAVLTPAMDPHGLIAHAVHSHLARSLSPQAALQAGLLGSLPPVARGWSDFVRDPTISSAGDIYTPAWMTDRTRSSSINYAPSSAFDFLPPPPVRVPRHSMFAELLAPYTSVTIDTLVSAPPRDPPSLPPPPIDFAPPDPSLLLTDVAGPDSRECLDPISRLYTQQVDPRGSLLPLRHSRRDPATYNLSVTKRINARRARSQLTGVQCRAATALRKGFRKFFDVPPQALSLNPALWEHCVQNRLKSWAGGRTIVDLRRIVAQSDPEWDPTFTRLFLKSQAVKKMDKVGGPAKPGQIVATFPLAKTLRDSTYALYVEKLAFRWCLPTTYLHGGASFADMQRFYSRYWVPGSLSTANDYTAWDSGCDEVFLDFDTWVLTMAGLPDDYVERYRYERLNTSSYLGPMPCMQFSGDRWTWLLNTLRNAAITGATLDCKVGTVACFSGDDSLVLGQHHPITTHKYRMSPKLEVGRSLLFCGFRYGGTDLVVSPDVVLLRARIGLEDGRRDSNFWDSIDYAARLSCLGRYAPEEVTTAYAISLFARSLYSLPRSNFPLSSSPLALSTFHFRSLRRLR